MNDFLNKELNDYQRMKEYAEEAGIASATQTMGECLVLTWMDVANYVIHGE